VAHSFEGLRKKLARFGSDHLPAFGRPTDFFVNYTPDHAVQFDLSGKPLFSFDRAHRIGKASLSLSGRVLTEDELALVFGSRKTVVT
jgi:hypothetical protein